MMKKLSIGDIFYRSLMWILMAVSVIPLIWVIRTAFIPSGKALNLFALSAPTLENIRHVFETVPFLQYYGNTILITLLVLVVQLVLVTLAGYAFARMDFYGSKVLFVIFLAQMMIAPEVLILDEPVNGLDPVGMKEMRILFRRLVQEEEMTILMSSHLLSEIEQIADRVGVIADGTVVQEAEMADIRKQHPSDMEDYFISLIQGGADHA